MLAAYFDGLYQRTMREAYSCAEASIRSSLNGGGTCLDCGANDGYLYHKFGLSDASPEVEYRGIEWDKESVLKAQAQGINVIQGDLNQLLPYEDGTFDCVFALSLVEHLLMPCRFMSEAHRTLKDGGSLVLLTPNISTLFTAALILMGKMPSSGPHPDSDRLIHSEELFTVGQGSEHIDTEVDTPVHRHLVVFSFLVMKRYLNQLGFSEVVGRGFGLYPFPNFAQPLLEKVDPYHCHQMVFVAKK